MKELDLAMKSVLVFRHIECEGPGYLGAFLGKRAIPYELVAVDQGEMVPDNLPDCAGLVFMGGPMSVNDPLPWIEAETKLIRAAVERGMPVLGHCLGGQLIARALGGEVGPNAVKEIGWHPVERVPVSGPWLDAIPESFMAFHWHGETFSLPDGAEPLLTNDNCANQAFTRGSALALQCHVEMTADLVRQWVDLYADEISAPQGAVQPAGVILDAVEEKCTALQQAADALYSEWVKGLI